MTLWGDGWQVLQWPRPCSVTFHILPVLLLPGVAESPPALSESTVRIHETNHSSASRKQLLTAAVAMGVLPCDQPRRGTGEVRPRLATLPRLPGLCFSKEALTHAKYFILLWKSKTQYSQTNLISLFIMKFCLHKWGARRRKKCRILKCNISKSVIDTRMNKNCQRKWFLTFYCENPRHNILKLTCNACCNATCNACWLWNCMTTN